jgi:hypothetical protein
MNHVRENTVPFTPFHMGPGMLVKALLQGSFSLMVFGWSQILIDIQPLIAIVTGKGPLHGVTHTLAGATLIALVAAATGKHLSQWALAWVTNRRRPAITIAWWVAFLSAFIGTYSHLVLDGIMHTDMAPLAPYSHANPLLGLVSLASLYHFCIYSGLVGAVTYGAVSYRLSRRQRALDRTGP